MVLRNMRKTILGNIFHATISTEANVEVQVFQLLLITVCPLFTVMINPHNITVPAVFVSKATGELLKDYAQGEKAECCLFPSHYESTWTVLTISLISFTVICGIVVLLFYMPRHLPYPQGTSNPCQRVDAETVEALPCFVFCSAHARECHTGETCAICLEDYKDGETLKVLPCQHGRTLVS